MSAEGPNVGDKQQGRAGARAREAGATQDACADRDADAGWTLEPHICRACHSRLVSRPAADGGRRYHCTNCGLDAVGASAAVLCCCGMKIRRATQRHTSGFVLIDAGIRCIENPDPSPDFPSLYVAAEASKT